MSIYVIETAKEIRRILAEKPDFVIFKAMEENKARVKFSKENLNENQLIALTSLYYNVKNPSHVAWRIKTKQSDKSIRNAWLDYHGAGGVPLNGLKTRRRAEVNLFFTKL